MNNNPELERNYGILFESLKTNHACKFSNIINIYKIQILIIVAFLFQNVPLAQFLLFIIIYLLSLIYIVKYQPYEEFSQFLQSIIRELLFLVLSLLY